MDVQITIRFTTDDTEVVKSVQTLLGHTLPYMLDNVWVNAFVDGHPSSHGMCCV